MEGKVLHFKLQRAGHSFTNESFAEKSKLIIKLY